MYREKHMSTAHFVQNRQHSNQTTTTRPSFGSRRTLPLGTYKNCTLERNPVSFTTHHTHSNHRNWKFLINNFHSLIGELFRECENSLDRCNEVIGLFECYSAEFVRLRDTIQLLDSEVNFETPPKTLTTKNSTSMTTTATDISEIGHIVPLTSSGGTNHRATQSSCSMTAPTLNSSLVSEPSSLITTSTTTPTFTMTATKSSPRIMSKEIREPVTETSKTENMSMIDNDDSFLSEPRSVPEIKEVQANTVENLEGSRTRLSSERKRRKTPEELRKEQEIKLAKAESIRRKNHNEIVAKAKENIAKVSEKVKKINERKNQKRMQKQLVIAEKHEKAEERYEQFVKEKKMKAENETLKVKEVNWINALTIENKKLSILQKLDEAEQRRQELLEEEKRRLQESREKRRIKKICKFCDIEIRSKEFLVTHIASKQHKDKLTSLRLSDSANINCVITLPLYPISRMVEPLSKQEKQKIKKKEHELKQKAKRTLEEMNIKGEQYIKDMLKGLKPSKETNLYKKIHNILLEIEGSREQKNFGKLEATLQSLWKSLQIQNQAALDKMLQFILEQNGVRILNTLLNEYNSKGVNHRIVKYVVEIIRLLSKSESRHHFLLMSNQLQPLVGLIIQNFHDPDAQENFLSEAFNLMTFIISRPLATLNAQKMMHQLLSYTLNMCLLQRMKTLWGELLSTFPLVTGRINFNLAFEIVKFLYAVTKFVVQANKKRTSEEIVEEAKKLSQELVATFSETNIAETILLVASVLLQEGPPHKSKGKRRIPKLSYYIAHTSLQLWSAFAEIDLKAMQTILGSDENQVEVFHIINYLLCYCTGPEHETLFYKEKFVPNLTSGSATLLSSSTSTTPATASAMNASVTGHTDNNFEDDKLGDCKEEILHSLISFIGQYTANCPRNQEIMQWGHAPTILHRLCALPFAYFSDPKLKNLLFPTLLLACYGNYENINILQQEMSVELLLEYVYEMQTSHNVAFLFCAGLSPEVVISFLDQVVRPKNHIIQGSLFTSQ
jgi:hypothetical protein